jgi:hypothetical protein
MATTRHKSYTASIASVHTTSLNSLANNANSAASTAIDNTSNLDLYDDLTLTVATQGSARSTGASVVVYLIPALDGTNYDAVNETTAEVAAVFPLDAATTARQLTRRDVPIPPGLFEYFVRNQTGQAFAASGNILERRSHSLETS